MLTMPPSPKGRFIEKVTGTPSEITARGKEMANLGVMMRENADALAAIRLRAETQQGKAITSLRESIGDTSAVLLRAADLYEPVGPVVTAYGQELEAVQSSLNAHVDNCEELWTTYLGLPGSLDPRGVGGWFQPEEGSAEAEEQADEDAAKKLAYQNWQDEAELFDTDYTTWETAFDTATDGVTDEMSGKIEDGFWLTFGGLIGFTVNGSATTEPNADSGAKTWADASGVGAKSEASAVTGPRASGTVSADNLGVSASGDAGATAQADASAEAQVGPDGASAKAGASAKVGVGAHGRVTTEQGPLSSTTSAGVDVGAGASADASVAVGPDGVSAKAGAEGFVGAEAKVEKGFEFFGLGINASAGGTAGAGASANAEVSAGADGFSAEVGAKAALGLGASASLGLSFDPGEFVEDIEALWPF